MILSMLWEILSGNGRQDNCCLGESVKQGLNLQHASELPGGLVKPDCWTLTPSISDSEGLEKHVCLCSPNTFPGDVNTGGPEEHTLRPTLCYHWRGKMVR
jgi:hypothetical protein